MSDVQKPVEETPVAAPATETPAATETPVEAPAAEAPKDTPAETTEAAPAATEEAKTDAPAAEEAKEEAKEVTPASEGVLGYKAPGLVKGLRFSKRFLYFNDEAVEAKHLSVYRANEKPAVAHPVVAWATQTGKGLLFLTKRAEDKTTPAGIFSLADVSDISKDGSNEFHFKLNGHKHAFQASSGAERDSWVVALEAKSTEAKAEKETITSSEGYKAELEKLTKPITIEPVKKAVEPKEEVAATEEPKKDEAAPAEEAKDKVDAKSRSRSRKRASIFGSILGRKDEAEDKKEEPKEDEAEEPTAAETSTETPAVETSAAAEPVAESPAAPAEDEEIKEETEQATPAPKSKRTSIFGNFFQKVTSPSHEKSEKEATAPTETTPVASTAPQLDNPVEEVTEPETVTAPAAEAEASNEETAAEAPAAETPAAVKEKRRASFFNFNKKKGESDTEEGEPKKGNKLGGLFRSATGRKPKVEEAKEDKKEEVEAKVEPAVEESPEETQPAETSVPADESKPVVASTSTPVQAAA